MFVAGPECHGPLLRNRLESDHRDAALIQKNARSGRGGDSYVGGAGIGWSRTVMVVVVVGVSERNLGKESVGLRRISGQYCQILY